MRLGSRWFAQQLYLNTHPERPVKPIYEELKRQRILVDTWTIRAGATARDGDRPQIDVLKRIKALCNLAHCRINRKTAETQIELKLNPAAQVTRRHGR